MSARPFRLAAETPPERIILASVLRYLRLDRRVAWAHRFNSGAVRYQRPGERDRFVRFAFPGCPDVLGQLCDGRILAVECKTDKGQLSDDQRLFLATVEQHRGVAVVARSVDDVIKALNDSQPMKREGQIGAYR